MKRSTFILCALLLALAAAPAFAADDAVKQTSVPRPWTPLTANFGPGGTGLPVGLFTITDNILSSDGAGTRKYDKLVNSVVDTERFLNVIKLRYGIADGLDIRTATPVYNIHMDQHKTSDRTNYGVGDSTVQVRKVLLNQDKGSPLFLALDLGVILPTASVGPHSVNPIGNAAWGGVMGLGATYFLGSNRFDAEVNYAGFTEGAKNYEKGDRFRANIGYAYALNQYWDVGVEGAYEANAKSTLNDVKQRDMSSEFYAGPKLVYNYKPWGLNAGVDVLLPVYRWYQSNKSGSDDFKAELKITKGFNIGSLFQ
jgi:hypothetical protein